jgi:putative flippase GtrA
MRGRLLKHAIAMLGRALKIEFIRFGVVGAAGFVVSFSLLAILRGGMGMAFLPALILSNEGALISNFIFHEKWTYKHIDHTHKPLSKKFLHFHLSSWTGVALIVGIGLFCIKVLKLNYLVGQSIASFIVMFWNFAWTKLYIFQGKKKDVEPADVINT